MKSKYVEITLEKAQEWYNQGGDLKEIALQAFTEKELNNNFRNIVCFEDVIEKLADPDDTNYIIKELKHLSPASAASFKLNLIKQALNYGYKMNFTEDTYWVPRIFAVKVSNNQFINDSDQKIVARIKIDNYLYDLYSGSAIKIGKEGLGCFSERNGVADCYTLSFISCTTAEIAQHMGTYFAKEIFEAQYGDSIKYEWV